MSQNPIVPVSLQDTSSSPSYVKNLPTAKLSVAAVHLTLFTSCPPALATALVKELTAHAR